MKNYSSPDTLELADLALQIEERKQIIRDYLLNESEVSLSTMALYAFSGVEANITEILEPVLECLEYFQDPDFLMLDFIRLMQYTSEYNDQILPVISKIPGWLTQKEAIVSLICVFEHQII